MRYLGIGYFVHPIPLIAVLIVIVNDHFLKAAYPSWITGKLSDFAGLFFFPIFACAVWNLVRNILFQKPLGFYWLTLRQTAMSIFMANTAFIFLKLNSDFSYAYSRALGTLGYSVRVAADRTDLIALSVSALTWLYGKSQVGRGQRPLADDQLLEK